MKQIERIVLTYLIRDPEAHGLTHLEIKHHFKLYWTTMLEMKLGRDLNPSERSNANIYFSPGRERHIERAKKAWRDGRWWTRRRTC
jgi:hypothetical protein